MVGTPTLQNTGVGGNRMRGTTGKAAAPPEAAAAGQKKIVRRGGTGWSDLMAAVNCFGPAETMQEFLKKLLK